MSDPGHQRSDGDLSKVQELVQLLQCNRDRHKEAWRKVRIDRLKTCFPDWTMDELQEAVYAGVDEGTLELAIVLDKETNREMDAVKLKRWLYKR